MYGVCWIGELGIIGIIAIMLIIPIIGLVLYMNKDKVFKKGNRI